MTLVRNSAARRSSSSFPFAWYATAFAICAAVFIPMGLARFIDGDEGYILMAAKLLAAGRLPYRDFFFPQGPLTAIAYAYLLPQVTWYGARILSGLFAAGTGMLLITGVGQFATRRVVYLSGLAFITNMLALGWLPIAKTYGLGVLLLYAAHQLSLRCAASPRGRLVAASVGVCCVAAVSARLYLAVAVPIIAITIWNGGNSDRRPRLGFFFGGVLFAAGILAPIPLMAPRSAFFSMVGYHIHRSGLDWLGATKAKWEVATQFLALRHAYQATALQQLILIGMVVRGGKGAWGSQAAQIALALFLTSMLLSPTFFQYSCLLVPFLIEAAARGTSCSLSSWPTRLAAASVGLTYLACSGHDGWGYLVSGRYVDGVDRPERWRIETVREAGKRIDALSHGGPVLSSWPGYLIESSANPWSGSENHFALDAAAGIHDRRVRLTLHVLSAQDEVELLLTDAVPIVVNGNWIDSPRAKTLDWNCRNNGYHICEDASDLHIWSRDACKPKL